MNISKMKKFKLITLAFLLLTIVITAQLSLGSSSQLAFAQSSTSSANSASPTCPYSSTVQGNCIVTNYIKPAIEFLSAGVGVVIIAMIIVGAIQYSTSGGNPQGEADAKKKIFNALLALLVFIFIYAFLNFIVPGGVPPL